MGAPTVHAMSAFRRVVETKSFKGAAESLGLSGGAVSKLVAQLEADLGAQLLNRTTRSVSLTESGARFYAAAAQILDDIGQATALVRSSAGVPSGLLRVSVPTSFALMCLSGKVPDFLVRCPEVQLQLNLDDRYVDLIEGGYDCAIRIAAQMPDSSLVARRLGEAPRVLVAAPRYLKHAPALTRPEDLVHHNCLTQSASAAPSVWSFRSPAKKSLAVEVTGSLRVNNSVMLRHALLAGCGVSLTPLFVVADLVAEKRLTSVLERYLPSPLTVYGVTANARYVPPKVKAFLDFVEQVCQD